MKKYTLCLVSAVIHCLLFSLEVEHFGTRLNNKEIGKKLGGETEKMLRWLKLARAQTLAHL